MKVALTTFSLNVEDQANEHISTLHIFCPQISKYLSVKIGVAETLPENFVPLESTYFLIMDFKYMVFEFPL